MFLAFEPLKPYVFVYSFETMKIIKQIEKLTISFLFYIQ